MKIFTTCILIGTVIFMVLPLAQAQTVIRHRVEGDVFLLMELGVILTAKDNSVLVDRIMPVDMRPKENRKIEIKKSDEILMVNRKRVKSIEDFKAIYESASAGDEIKLGLKRESEMMLVAFKKADQSAQPRLGPAQLALQLADLLAQRAHLGLQRLGVSARTDDLADLAGALVAPFLELLDLDEQAAPPRVQLLEPVEGGLHAAPAQRLADLVQVFPDVMQIEHAHSRPALEGRPKNNARAL